MKIRHPAKISETHGNHEENAKLLKNAKEKLQLLRKDPWRLEYLQKWFNLQIQQRKNEIENDLKLKEWVFKRYKLVETGNKDFKIKSFLKTLIIQEQHPNVSNKELMLGAMIISSAYDFYKKEGKF